MKLVFVSNFMNHHQLYVSQEFCKKSEYTFIATEKIEEERLSLGYKDMNKEYDFILRSYDSDEEYNRAIAIINEADVVIYGSCPFEMIKQRIEDNKLTFRYSERLFKNLKLVRMFHPKVIKNIYNQCTKYKDNNYYLLCASAYSKADYNWFGAFKNKCFKWGYFPKVSGFDNISQIVEEKNKFNNILWCGRLIDWKHPEFAIKAAKYLKKKNVPFKIKMVGTGNLKNKIEKIVEKENLTNYIEVVGALPFDKVQDEMLKAKIFLFTSDQNEGWGAVLNESMGNACCVIANKRIGSVPYIIEHGTNGFIYKNTKDFLRNLEYACKNNVEEICKNAYKSIHDTWNHENAVNEFFKLVQNIKNNNNITYKKAPCHRA